MRSAATAKRSDAPRRRAAAAMVAACAALAGCSEPPPEPRLRLLEFAGAATYTPDPERDERRDLIVGERLGPDDWRPVLKVGSAPDPAALARFLEVARVTDGGAVELGPARGAWLATVPVEGGGPVCLAGRLTFSGPRIPGPPGPADPRVVVSLVELTGDPGPGADAELADALVALHGTRPMNGRTRSVDLALTIDLDPRTRALGVLCSQESELETGPTARLESLAVFRPGFVDIVAAATDEGRRRLEPGEPLEGLFRIGMVSRPGLAAAPGDELELPLPVPASGGRLEGWLGLASHPVAADGTPVVVTLAARAASGGARTVLLEQQLHARPAAERRWQRFDVALPRGLRGEAAMLQLEIAPVTGRTAPELLPVVLASPRVVPGRGERRGPNVVLISIDTLRPDHLGAYGYDRPTSPAIDALAAESVVFDDAWAQGPYTLPSHMSLLTGQHPSVHGALRDPGSVDPERTTLLAELFARAGYATGAFVGGGYLLPSFGFAPGFDTYSLIDPSWNRESRRIRDFIRDAEELSWELADAMTMDVVVDWIGEHADESFFLFVHTYAAHEFDPPAAHRAALGVDSGPLDDHYEALRWLTPVPDRPATVSVEDRRLLTDFYDAAIHQADAALGVLLDGLERLQLDGDTVVVLTSDHGKEIGDHGDVGHGHSLYEEVLQVPLMVRAPGLAPGRSARPVMLVDIVPTIARLAGLAPPVGLQGTDLFTADDAPRTLWAEVDAAAHKYAARSGARKTIWGPQDTVQAIDNRREEETFDLAIDPREQRPLPPDPARIDAVRGYRDALRTMGEALGGTGRTRSEMSGATRAQLEALGYTVGE